LFASALLAVQLLAAEKPKAARRAAIDGPNRPRAGLAAAAAGGTGAFEQVLTDEQRKKFREFTQANGEQNRASQQELIKLRRELQEAVVDGKADEAFIKARTEAIAKVDAEVLAARMSAMAKVAVSFTPEQKEKMKELSKSLRPARPGLGAGRRNADGPPRPREPAAPPPPEK
jgi:Spy/CpxP family protein refolding chaperone